MPPAQPRSSASVNLVIKDSDQNDYCVLVDNINKGVLRGANITKLFVLAAVCDMQRKDDKLAARFENGGLACTIFRPLMHTNQVVTTIRADRLVRLDSLGDDGGEGLEG